MKADMCSAAQVDVPVLLSHIIVKKPEGWWIVSFLLWLKETMEKSIYCIVFGLKQNFSKFLTLSSYMIKCLATEPGKGWK